MKETVDKINQFVDERNWRQFHKPKDLALSVSLEAAELLELFQWKDSKEVVENNTQELKDEIADVMIYSIMLADDLGFDIEEIINQKILKNAEKYPVDKSKGSNKKYTEL